MCKNKIEWDTYTQATYMFVWEKYYNVDDNETAKMK